jgi:hypothetical protein
MCVSRFEFCAAIRASKDRGREVVSNVVIVGTTWRRRLWRTLPRLIMLIHVNDARHHAARLWNHNCLWRCTYASSQTERRGDCVPHRI